MFSEVPVNEDTSGVKLIVSPDKGRGIAVCRAVSAGEVLLTCPVKVLNALEFQMLRLMPAITSYLGTVNFDEQEDTMMQVFRGLEALVQNPETVLAGNQSSEASNSTIMYTFSWDSAGGQGEETAAIAFGIASLCNHASKDDEVNAKVVRHFDAEQLSLVATKEIPNGAEILIRYTSTPFVG